MDLTTRRHLPENHPLAYAALAFIASAGIFYVNIVPGITSALVTGIGFSEAEAGYVMSANAYGNMTGAVAAVFLVTRVSWKPLILGLFLLQMTIDATTSLIDTPALMVPWRFFAGLAGGCAVGIGFSAMGRLTHPDRAFGALLMVQTGLGALVIYGRAWLESSLGEYGVFFVLVAFTGFSASLVPLVGRYEWRAATGKRSTGRMRITTPLVLLLAALFLFQSSANGIWVYLERIGVVAGLDSGEVSGAVALGTALGIPGALVAIVLGNRYGRLRVLMSGLVLTFGGATFLLDAQPLWRFFAGSGLIGFAWGYALPYLLGSAADIHPSGQGATAGGVASKLGLATGPLIAATLLDAHGFGTAIGASLAGLTLCALAAFLPVSGLDRRRSALPALAADP